MSTGSATTPKFTQANRPIRVTTPLGADVLLLEKFEGREAISELFVFRLSLLALASQAVTFADLLGQSITVELDLVGSGVRYFNGIASRVSRIDTRQREDVVFSRYSVEVVPSIWNLSRVAQSRIFQQKSVVDILKVVLAGLTVDYTKLTGTYNPRDYCVQYRETDLDFASRLMEDEGIFYWFTHADGSHKLVLGDSADAHVALTKSATYRRDAGMAADAEWVESWRTSQEIRSGKVTLRDHSFELPDQNLEATKAGLTTVQVGSKSQSLSVGGSAGFERYDYPGEYAKRYAGIDPGGGEQASVLQKVFDDNTRTANFRMQREAVAGFDLRAESTCRAMAAGSKFTLAGHPVANGTYVLTEVNHAATVESSYRSARAPKFSYGNRVRCIPAALPFRPERSTPRPRIGGVQTAVVVGQDGQEITTDKYGRVKVKFFWDRAEATDATCSCWVRVASPWAGKQWGMVHIPRIGQEVLVDFLEGDPDRPIIVGSVYNAAMMPPYTLPANMTQSGLKSRSTTQGETTNFNELRFEDKKGSEQVYFHAERDFVREVENNDSLTVGGSDSNTCPDGSQTISVYKDRTESVETGNESVTIKKGNRTITVSEGDDAHTVTKGKRTVTVQSDDTHDVKAGDRKVTIDAGKDNLSVANGRTVTIKAGGDSLTVQAGDHKITVSTGGSTIEATTSITLKVGGNSITIGTDGITISGLKVAVSANTQAQISGTAEVQIQGGVVMIN